MSNKKGKLLKFMTYFVGEDFESFEEVRDYFDEEGGLDYLIECMEAYENEEEDTTEDTDEDEY